MLKEIIEALTTKFPGVSASIIGRIAAKLAKTVTTAEKVKEAVDAVTIQQLLESYGDSRATEASRTAVENYESKYGLKDGEKTTPAPAPAPTPAPEPKPNPAPAPKPADAMPAWAKALLENTQKLTGRIDSIESARTAETRRRKLDETVAKLPEALRAPYRRTPLEGLSDDEFNALITEVTAEVEQSATQLRQRGTVFNTPAGGGGNNNGELSEAQVKAISHREGKIGPDQQPF